MHSKTWGIVPALLLAALPAQAGDWGPWRTPYPEHSGLEIRVRKNYFNDAAKKWHWDYQVRNRYNRWAGLTIRIKDEGAPGRFLIAPGDSEQSWALTADRGEILHYQFTDICFGNAREEVFSCTQQREAARQEGNSSGSSSSQPSTGGAGAADSRRAESEAERSRVETQRRETARKEEQTRQEAARREQAEQQRQQAEAQRRQEEWQRRQAAEERRLEHKRQEDLQAVALGGSMALAGAAMPVESGKVAGDFVLAVGTGSLNNDGDDKSTSPRKPEVALSGRLSGLVQLRFYTWLGDPAAQEQCLEWRLQARTLNLDSGRSELDDSRQRASLNSYGAGVAYWYKNIAFNVQFQSSKLNLEVHEPYNPFVQSAQTIYTAGKDVGGARAGIILGNRRDKGFQFELGFLGGKGSSLAWMQTTIGWGFVRIEQERVSLTTPLAAEQDPRVPLAGKVDAFSIQLGMRIPW